MDDDLMIFRDEGKSFLSFSKQEAWMQGEIKTTARVFSAVYGKTRALRKP